MKIFPFVSQKDCPMHTKKEPYRTYRQVRTIERPEDEGL